MKLRTLMLSGALVFITSCATPEPHIVLRDVPIAVAVKCAADPGEAPQYADSDEALKAAPDIFTRVKLLLAGRAQRIARELELTAANSACR